MKRKRTVRDSQIQRAVRRSRWRLFGAWLRPRWLSIVNAAALFALGIALLMSPRFRVERVAVRRQSASARAAMTRATELSQVVGRNIFLVNTARVAEDVATIPSVLSARVVPHLPNTVEIEIVERVPIAVWQSANGAFLVDDQGYLIAEATPEGDAARPPLGVRDSTGRALRLGDQVDQRSLLATRELLKAMPAGVAVKEVEYAPEGIVFTTDGGWRIIFGPPDALNQKVANLTAVADMARAQRMNLKLIDLRPKEHPFFQAG